MNQKTQKKHFFALASQITSQRKYQNQFPYQTHGPFLTASSAAIQERWNERILPARALRALSPAAGVCYATPDNAGGSDSSPEFFWQKSSSVHSSLLLSPPVPFPCFCAISVTFVKGACYIIIAETTDKGISLPFVSSIPFCIVAWHSMSLCWKAI